MSDEMGIVEKKETTGEVNGGVEEEMVAC